VKVVLPAASEETFEGSEEKNGEKAAGEYAATISSAVAVVTVWAEVRTTDAIGVEDWPEDEAKDGGCYRDDDDCEKDEGKHRIFSIRAV
jgi:hypothetical protein